MPIFVISASSHVPTILRSGDQNISFVQDDKNKKNPTAINDKYFFIVKQIKYTKLKDI